MEQEAPPMDSSTEEVELRLRSLQDQLWTESAILDRIVHKNRNQHRRSPYFQRLLKVKRDLLLLKSAGLKEILSFMLPAINGKQQSSDDVVRSIEKLKQKQSLRGGHNFLNRLLGVARLLEQMIEPILKASIEISSLLALSFFMGFSLTVLALLARLRVLVQQLLLDVVHVFNKVTALTAKEHSVELNNETVKVFRDFYAANKQYVTLDCTWEGDKFCLHEKSLQTSKMNSGEDIGTTNAASILYDTMDFLLEEDGPVATKLESSVNDQSSETMEKQHSCTQSLFPSETTDTDNVQKCL